jgi:signal transduction histidine kinase/CheY-like chemotaxis protein
MPQRDASIDPHSEFLAGGGATGALMREHDWSDSPLGAPSTWPQSLRSVVGLLLGSQFPMFVAWGPELGFLYNDAYAEILGAKHPRALGIRFQDIWSEIWADIWPLIEAAMAGEATYCENLPLLMNRKGYDEQTWFTFSYSPVRDESGAVAGMFCAVKETTGQVLAERRLTEERERQRLMLQQMPGFAAMLAGPEHRYEYVNDAYREIAGDREFTGRSVREVFPELTGQNFFELLDHVYATGETFAARAMPLRLEGADGERFIDLIYEPIRDAGAVSGIFVGGYDVTERVLVEAALREGETRLRELNETLEARVAARTAELEATNEQLRQSQKLDSMGQLTGGVAHDLNNLLTPIMGSLDLLRRGGMGGEREQRMIDAALQSAERARVLVQRLLAFARRQPLQAVAVDVASLVGGLENLIASTSGPRTRVEVDLAPDLPPAKADPNQLELAILNLAVNARDAMPEGGTLTISGRREAVGPHHAMLTPGDYVRLSVADTGDGMDAATLERAVEPFFSTKGVGRGTGLGLSMAHGLASQLGGALTLASTPGLGTVVDLWLPVSSDAAKPKECGTVDPGIAITGTVLVVDDEDLVRTSTASMLEDIGFDVVEAASAEAALELLRDGLAPDLIVTDHLMPGVSGTELARKLRADGANVPVLVVSGYAEAEGIAPELPRLTKPFLTSDLTAALAGLPLLPRERAPAYSEA